MRFLFLTTLYSTETANPYMTDELAEGLIARGHCVDVLLIDWDAVSSPDSCEVRGRNGERIVRVTPRALRKFGKVIFRASKLLLSSRYAAAAMLRHFDCRQHDAVIAWTPAISIGAPLRRAVRGGIPHRLLIIFDFFPMCHREAGIIRSRLVYWVARQFEERLYRLFTGFIANLPGNVEYLRRHFPVSPGARVLCSPIWGDTTMPPPQERAEVRTRLSLPLDRPIAVFGGQFSEGRGIEQMIGAAQIAEQVGTPTLYLFIGEGRLRPMIEDAARRCANIRLQAPVTRSEYLSLIGACDIGMVATIKEFTSSAFPSKTIDYLRAGLPIVTAVEPASDYPALLEPYMVIRNVECGDSAAFQAAVEEFAINAQPCASVRELARRCLEEVFDVRHAVNAVLRAVGEPADLQDDHTKPIVRRMAVTA
ncbi:MAG TPA: glycosyltransferase family 4 protein [Sphingomicrobium sp.]|jgi:glycosyltransferase involved in cell wall biosynthesis|nr:glycosyltransferase family 4 protein [Sphingomicrobium sp.]